MGRRAVRDAHPSVVVNQAYAPQRVSGQQRYAVEIVERLGAQLPVEQAAPTGRWASSTLWTWLWVQVVLPLRSRRRTVLSLTSRAPLWRRRHVLVVHDLFVLTHPEWYSRTYIWTHAPLLRAQLRSAAAVVAVSRPTADAVAAFRHDVVAVAPNAPSSVFRTRPPGPDDEALRARGIEAGEYLLVVGNKDPRKNLPRLAASYAALDDDERKRHPLVVVGGSAAIYRDEEIDWPPETVQAGYVADTDLRQLYRHARAVVFVPLAEGFGLPIVEAVAAGARGLLVSDIPVFHWICGDRARYADPRSVEAIAGALRTEIEYPQEADHDSAPWAEFDWDASAAVVADVCRRVAGEA